MVARSVLGLPCVLSPSPLLPEPTHLSPTAVGPPHGVFPRRGPIHVGARTTVRYPLFFTGRRNTSLISHRSLRARGVSVE